VRERDLVLSDTQHNFYPSVYTEILLPILHCTSFSHTHFLKWLYTHTHTHAHRTTSTHHCAQKYQCTQKCFCPSYTAPLPLTHTFSSGYIYTHTHTHTISLSPDTQNDSYPSYSAPLSHTPSVFVSLTHTRHAERLLPILQCTSNLPPAVARTGRNFQKSAL